MCILTRRRHDVDRRDSGGLKLLAVKAACVYLTHPSLRTISCAHIRDKLANITSHYTHEHREGFATTSLALMKAKRNVATFWQPTVWAVLYRKPIIVNGF